MPSITWMYPLLWVAMVMLLPGNEACDPSKCAIPACDSPVLKPGACCPECLCMYNGVTYDIEEIVDKGDPCEICECGPYGIDCLRPPCPPMYGCNGHVYRRDGECCNTCGCLVDGVTYEIGFQVLDRDPCKECRCGYDGTVKCITTTCPALTCSHPYRPRKQCCKKCGCRKGRKEYDFGPVPREDKCSPECVCLKNGRLKCKPLEYKCTPPLCTRRLRYRPEGKCCEKCRCLLKTKDVSQLYNPGQEMPIPAGRKCTARCYCDESGRRQCDDVRCPRLPCSNPVTMRGDCCPSCGCLKKKTLYPFGPILDDPCQPCECHKDGTITCAKRQSCPNMKCAHGKYEPANGTRECCPKCRCKSMDMNGTLTIFAPGEIFRGPKCGSCECHATTGSVSCERMPCSAQPLLCANPTLIKRGGSCMPVCADGPTCIYKKHVIKYGVYKKVGKKVCTCLGDPWFPNAFCTKRTVKKKDRIKLNPLSVDFEF